VTLLGLADAGEMLIKISEKTSDIFLSISSDEELSMVVIKMVPPRIHVTLNNNGAPKLGYVFPINRMI
jgi:hypothetical protein